MAEKRRLGMRRYDHEKQTSGVHTLYLGEQKDPLVQCFDAYYHNNRVCASECIRRIITTYFQYEGLLDSNGGVTKKFDLYRKQADERKKDFLDNTVKKELEELSFSGEGK